MEQSTSPNLLNRAIKTSVTVFGIIGGIISIEHGILEVLRGNTPTNGFQIDAIGPGSMEYFRQGATESAVTLIPNFLITGIFAVLAGIIGIYWSSYRIGRSHGALGLFAISIFQFLVGGGIAYLLLAIIASVVATRIISPLNFWKKYLDNSFGSVIKNLWIVFVTLFPVIFITTITIALVGIRSLGNDDTMDLLWTLGYSTIILQVCTILTAFAYDIHVT